MFNLSSTNATHPGCSDGTLTFYVGDGDEPLYFVEVTKDGQSFVSFYQSQNEEYTLNYITPGEYYATLYTLEGLCPAVSNNIVVSSPECQLFWGYTSSVPSTNAACGSGILNFTVVDAYSQVVYASLYNEGIYMESFVFDSAPNSITGLAPGNYELVFMNVCNACSTTWVETVPDQNFCPYDLDCNFYLNTNDLLVFASAFGCSAGCGPGDYDDNGVINIVDLLQFAGQFGQSCE